MNRWCFGLLVVLGAASAVRAEGNRIYLLGRDDASVDPARFIESERTGGQTLPLDLVAGETCWFALEARR